MKIVVCVKQVPSTNEVRLDPETNTIIRDGKQSVINPFDTYALEEAIRIKEKIQGEVIALSMGIPATEKILRDAVSVGADSGMLLSDRSFAGADTLATAYTLSLGVKKISEVDLILCGKMAVDGDTAQIGPELAENLKIPHITNVSEIIEVNDSEIICRTITETGNRLVKTKTPVLLTVLKDINMPRLPSIDGVINSLDAPVAVENAESLGANKSYIGLSGSPTQVVKTYIPERKNESIEIKGDSETKSEKINSVIKEVI